MTFQSVSKTYFIRVIPSHQSVCLYEYAPIVASQRLGKSITAATNTQETMKELLN
jgi:hypothetical protein